MWSKLTAQELSEANIVLERALQLPFVKSAITRITSMWVAMGDYQRFISYCSGDSDPDDTQDDADYY
ncbi:MAG TPA: hypothetical protein VEP90_04410 [Methylomirabilota bacterium]|nr:hypothetical protein [Methylomirabilota bacterium]